MPARPKNKLLPADSDDDDVLHFTPVAYNEDLLDVNFAPLPDADIKGGLDEALPDVDIADESVDLEADGNYNDEEVTETITEPEEAEIDTAQSPEEKEVEEEDIDITPTVVFKPKTSRQKPRKQYTGMPLEPEESSSDDEDASEATEKRTARR